jgi:DNA-binding NtrC family response regulator
MAARARLLVVDDEAEIRDLLSELLTDWGHEVVAAAGGREAIEFVSAQLFEAVLLDLYLGPDSGVDVLREIRAIDTTLDVVVMTAFPTVETAVQALRDGAADYLTKPLNLEELRHVLGRVLERRVLRREVSALRQQLGEQLTSRELLGSSPAMRQVKEMLGLVAVNDTSVLIEGESGTGKELAAAPALGISPLRVLVVDDQAAVRALVAEALRVDGHTVDTAVDYESALDWLAAGGYDLVLTDDALPGPLGHKVRRLAKPVDVEALRRLVAGVGAVGVA